MSLGLSFKKHPLYSDFIQVKARLKASQFVCWVAGGAVRDLFLGRAVYDFDLVTDASTENLKVIFPEAVLVGESFGVLKIPVSGGAFFDLATFRQESDYTDGRRPSKVAASTPLEDAKRRDFTINALFWDDENQQLIDYVSGQQDLLEKRLICVGSAEVRFEEDYLRIVRLIRFAAQLGFSIDSVSEKQAVQRISQIKKISGERIWTEMKKMAQARNWKFVLSMSLFQLFLSEIFEIDIKKHNISTPVATEEDLRSLFFVLINLKANEADIRKILAIRLKLSKAELSVFDQMQFSIENLLKKSVAECAFEIEKRPGLDQALLFLAKQNLLDQDQVEASRILLQQNPHNLVNGQELVETFQGARRGEILDEVRLLQLQGKLKTKDEARRYIATLNHER